MSFCIEKMQSEYQLRSAAGQYYLLHMSQKGVPYEQPLVLNTIGAEIWRLLLRGNSTEQMADQLGQKYNVETGEIKKDILYFYSQLKEYGVM